MTDQKKHIIELSFKPKDLENILAALEIAVHTVLSPNSNYSKEAEENVKEVHYNFKSHQKRLLDHIGFQEPENLKFRLGPKQN